MLKRISEQELREKALTDEQRREILSLMGMREEDIDLSDIPEINSSKFQRVRLRQAVYLESALASRLNEIAERKGVSLNDLVNELLKNDLAIAETLG